MKKPPNSPKIDEKSHINTKPGKHLVASISTFVGWAYSVCKGNIEIVPTNNSNHYKPAPCPIGAVPNSNSISFCWQRMECVNASYLMSSLLSSTFLSDIEHLKLILVLRFDFVNHSSFHLEQTNYIMSSKNLPIPEKACTRTRTLALYCTCGNLYQFNVLNA